MKILTFFMLSFCSAIAWADTNNLGAQTYQIACKNCHAPTVAPGIKAPAAFDSKAWKKRFAIAAKKSRQDPKKFQTALDYLVFNATMGKALMPHGGLCHEADVVNKNCSNQALKAAILYMSQPRIN